MTLAAQRPVPGAPRPYAFPRFVRERLRSGMHVISCHLPGRPLASALLLLEAGAENEPVERGGVAALAAAALTEGTERRSGRDFADAAERLGADVYASSDWDEMHVAATAPVARLEAAVELAAEAVRQPAFPEREVARLRQERLNRLMQELANPQARVRHALLPAIYEAGSAYARPADGGPETVATLTRDDAEAYFRRFATPASATLVVTGDLDVVTPSALAERLFGDWEVPEPDRAPSHGRGRDGGRTATLVRRPGSVQSAIAVGHVGVPRNTPDYHALRVLDAILGGMFNSRLNMRLREEKGYTYGAYTQLDMRRGPGSFSAGAAVQTAVTGDALGEMIAQIAAVHEHGVTEAELRTAVDYLTGVTPLRYETPDRIAEGIASLVIYGLPDDFHDRFRPAMETLTVDDVARAARERLRPERLSIVVVGDGAVEEPLRAGDFGPLEIVDDPPFGGS